MPNTTNTINVTNITNNSIPHTTPGYRLSPVWRFVPCQVYIVLRHQITTPVPDEEVRFIGQGS